MAEQFKRQHIVPQAYLKRFAEKKGKNYIIGTRLNESKAEQIRFFQRSVADVAFRTNYYDTQQQKDSKHWEHYLGECFDTLCGIPLGKIISKITLSVVNSGILSTEDIRILSQIVFAQIIRVPGFLERETKRVGEVAEQYKKELKGIPNLTEEKYAVIEKCFSTDDEIKNLILDNTFDKQRFEKYCSVLQEKTWIVFYNGISSFMPFITSDNPVLLVDVKRQPVELTELGIASDELILMFPVSPSILIGIYPSAMYLGYLKAFDRSRIVLTHQDEKFIIDLNLDQIEHSYIHSFIPEPLYSLAKRSDRNGIQ